MVADALFKGADSLITVGAIQSNHARLTAVCGSMVGLETHLVLGGDAEARRGGNLILDHLAGAHVHTIPSDDWGAMKEASQDLDTDLRDAGKETYLIPLGASGPLGQSGTPKRISRSSTSLTPLERLPIGSSLLADQAAPKAACWLAVRWPAEGQQSSAWMSLRALASCAARYWRPPMAVSSS